MTDGTTDEIEAAARAIREVFAQRVWRDLEEPPTPWEKLKPWQHEGYREEARAAVAAADAARAARAKANCMHTNRQGSGTISFDGFSSWKWFCAACGASGESSTPARSTSPEYGPQCNAMWAPSMGVTK